MDFGLSEDQELLQSSARDFLAAECPTTFVREVMASTDGAPRTLQAKMAELGWTGLIVPQKFGGLGMSMLDLAVLMEEFGRAVVPGPFFSSAVLGTVALAESSNASAKRTWLPRLASGEATATLALLEANDRLDADGVELKAAKTRTGYRLNGTKMFVTDAAVADVLIVAARRGKGDTGVCLLAVPRETPGVTIEPLASIDGTRRPFEVRFENADVTERAMLAEDGQGWRVVQRVLDAASIALAADSLGGSQRVLEMAVDYSKVREQFGRKIGSFQAVKHMAAEVVADVEPARSLVWYAAYAYDREPKRASLSASMAKARLSDVYMRSANTAVQMHGGVGFTWEHDMHLWFKRAKWNELSFGDASFHRERVACLAGF